MKYLIILGDGMADWAVPALDNKTLLQYAHTPHMDRLARMGRTGMLRTVADGFHPGSEVANMSVLGYDLNEVYEGRGVLEAANIGVDLTSDEIAARCNLVCIEGDILKNHSSGHITTEEADVLIQYLQEHLGDERVRFHTGVQYRHLLVIKGGDKRLHCSVPVVSPGSTTAVLRYPSSGATSFPRNAPLSAQKRTAYSKNVFTIFILRDIFIVYAASYNKFAICIRTRKSLMIFYATKNFHRKKL